jgi:hypothetical protein
MNIWPIKKQIEGKAEIFLRWRNLFIILLMIALPLIVALLAKSIIIKIILGAISALLYIIFMPVQGPCITALLIMILPWYLYFELEFLPRWLYIIAIIISLIEIDYIRNRMRFLQETRKKEGILL